MIISEKQILKLFQVLKMTLSEFELNREYRLHLMQEIMSQQSEELKDIK